jgi:pimeloyl-ACP methyl ester carboxylesterase
MVQCTIDLVMNGAVAVSDKGNIGGLDVGGERSVERDRRLAYAEAPRALAEIASLLPAAPYLTLAPRGDGHPVLVLPGLGGGDGSTLVIRRYLAGQGFATAPWNLGRNLGPAMDELSRRLAERLEAVWREGHGRKVSLVGWSLGGVYARLLAQRFPQRIRQVVTLGSPIGGLPRPSPAYRAMRQMQGVGIDRERVLRLRQLAGEALPGIPGTAVYSRTDGIVPWQIARQTPSETAENVEVYGSHIGLGFNPSTLYLLAERLAQPEDGWRAFQRSGWKSWVYGPDRSDD